MPIRTNHQPAAEPKAKFWRMAYSAQINEIIDSIRPDMDILGTFAFQGRGDINKLRISFIRCYEAAKTGIELFKQNFPHQEIPLVDSLCGSDNDIIPMQGFYEHLSAEDFEPKPFDAPQYAQNTLILNQIFMSLLSRQ